MIRRGVPAAALGTALASAALTVLAGCGLQPSGVEDGPAAPTGVAPGVTLYFLDDDGALTAQRRETDQLGTVSSAVALLLTGPGDSSLHSDIDDTSTTRTEVTVSGERLTVRVPLATYELTARGVDQIVCTALASHIQAGGSPRTKVSVLFTDRQQGPRTCPVID